MLADHDAPHPDTLPSWHYCFECREYLQCNLDWRALCEQQLQLLEDSCGPMTCRNIVIVPGRCSFCLSEKRKSAEKRCSQWRTMYELQDHIWTQHLSRQAWPLPCKPRNCCEEIQSPQAFWYHVDKSHDIREPDWKTSRWKDRKGCATLEDAIDPALLNATADDTAQASTAHHGQSQQFGLDSDPTTPFIDMSILLPVREVQRLAQAKRRGKNWRERSSGESHGVTASTEAPSTQFNNPECAFKPVIHVESASLFTSCDVSDDSHMMTDSWQDQVISEDEDGDHSRRKHRSRIAQPGTAHADSPEVYETCLFHASVLQEIQEA